MKPLRLLPQAEEEIDEALRWFSEIHPDLAEAFKLDLEHTLQRLLRRPAAWPPHRAGTRRILVERFRYAVVYRDSAAELLVVAVMHQARRPGYWRGRKG
jgi:plasmid stabilization system protein ParE